MLIKLTHAHVIGTIIAYLIGVCLVPLVISFSKKEGLVDLPNERKIHTKPISRIGGVAIWLSAMLSFLSLVFLSYYPYGSLLSGILLGSSLMFLLGLIDDIYNLDAKFKLFIQYIRTSGACSRGCASPSPLLRKFPGTRVSRRTFRCRGVQRCPHV